MAAQALSAQKIVHQVCGSINIFDGRWKKRQVFSCSMHWGEGPFLGPEEKPGLIDYPSQGCVQAGLKVLDLALMTGGADLLG